jgi:Secretion system C-terminal sorting domain
MYWRRILPLWFLCFVLYYRPDAQQVLVFHTIQTDSNGYMISWYNPDPGISYDHDLQLIWNFWNNIPTSLGTKFYMTDHSYAPTQQANMVGGDQFAMAMSSWGLYYAYTGDTALVENMAYIANTYLANSMSAGNDAWPNIPYPCNPTNPSLPVYDGDYVLGAGYTQPDKAGSFAFELLTLYKITGDTSYLNTAISISNTLATKVAAGDSANSPYPFKVNAHTGTTPLGIPGSNYTTNFVPILVLFEQLSAMGAGNVVQYDSAYNTIKTWIQKYPQHTNNWGCFFEDIVGPSNTETNAVTMARYIINHPNWDSTYKQDARAILDWTFQTFADTAWNQYGATAIYEQSADLKPGGSHTSRYASTELIYAERTGDTSRVAEAIRELNWATYLCDTNGQCRFSPAENSVWYTDGYGDYVRHFLRAMAAYPKIAPATANHLLGTSSVISWIQYLPQEIDYKTWDSASYETLRLTSKPNNVLVDGIALSEQSNLSTQGWVWTPYTSGGALRVRHNNGHSIQINWYPSAVNAISHDNLSASIYPNPASGNQVIVSYGLDYAQNVDIQLYTISGQIMREESIQGQQNLNTSILNINGLSSGVYIVKLKTEQGSFLNKLLITGK